MQVHERAKLISDRLAEGRLPRARSINLWAGFGNGRPCDACGEPIHAAEVEHEHDLVGGAVLRLHAACSVLWQRLTTAP